MKKDTSIFQNLKEENRNRIYNTIREKKCISGPALIYELKLSRPTVTQNINELLEEGLICENGTIGNTGGRRARGYSISEMFQIAAGLDITRNHITVLLVNLNGEIIYEKRIRYPFSITDEYKKKLGELISEAMEEKAIHEEQMLGVGIAVPGLVTKDYRTIFYGKILDFKGMTAEEFGKYIPFPCRLYNDADAGGYAEISQNSELKDAFYISLSNNIGGSILIDHKVYHGEGQRSGEVGHMTLIPNGRECYCGKRGCFETYCNASILSDVCDGNLQDFFQKLEQGDRECMELWRDYLYYLSIAVNNVRMLFDCKVILGGYVGAYMSDYMHQIRTLARERNTFETNADFLQPCQVKREALALGSALPFIHEFWEKV
ncbi:ROK family protein [Blautia sp. HCP3S3_G3]|uniref:ROK family transcriptional regulator n=1 Tax=Blautia sp. HCP3S3_G3 TaxID=3438913 RepID=UPI003F8BEE75